MSSKSKDGVKKQVFTLESNQSKPNPINIQKMTGYQKPVNNGGDKNQKSN